MSVGLRSVLRAGTRALVWLALGVAACGDPSADAPPAANAPTASAAALTAPSASDASLSLDPGLPAIERTAPRERAARDEAACANGEARGCRAMADRHRGYGAPAGCGVDRGSASARIKRVADDTDHDALRYQHFIDRACELGDDEACDLADLAEASRNYPTHAAEDLRLRSRIEDSALYRFQKATLKGDKLAMLEVQRKTCRGGSESWWHCAGLEGSLYTRDSKPKEALPPELRAELLSICRATRECEDLVMMLDRSVYPADAVAALRPELGEALAEACREGDCVCGQAAALLGAGDARRLALAKAGCDDGEAEGCFQLGLAYEEGRGVEKDPTRARALYELACPAVRPAFEWRDGPRQGEYAPRACDRLAALHEAGEGQVRSASAAWYYAASACQRPGFERDHAPCMRLARYHWLTVDTGRNLEDTLDTSRGSQSHPSYRKECLRPSVAAACAELDALVAKGRPPKP